MNLLWMDRTALTLLKNSVGQETNATFVVIDDKGAVREPRITARDVEWAEEVYSIAERASAASAAERYGEAIDLYRQALLLAPGCDLYLMSIGCCYANMGHPREGIKYLERAAQISPNNARIRRNLAGVRGIV